MKIKIRGGGQSSRYRGCHVRPRRSLQLPGFGLSQGAVRPRCNLRPRPEQIGLEVHRGPPEHCIYVTPRGLGSIQQSGHLTPLAGLSCSQPDGQSCSLHTCQLQPPLPSPFQAWLHIIGLCRISTSSKVHFDDFIRNLSTAF